MTTLEGITWDHSRGYTPLAATSQRYGEMNPRVAIHFQKRSLHDFGHFSIDQLADKFDLLVVDHPHMGSVAKAGCLLPLEDFLAGDFFEDQKNNQVGNSHNSYFFGGHQWALAADAAAPVASWRADEFERLNLKLPTTWEALIELARSGYVAFPSVAVDSLMHFYSLYLDDNGSLFDRDILFTSEEAALLAIERLKGLIMLCDSKILRCNPIQIYEMFAAGTSRAIYCPFAFGYSNYSRSGYGENAITFGNVIPGPSGKRLRAVLGGAGLAISRSCKEIERAADFLKFVTSPKCQRTMYFDSGGQPAHREAWLDAHVNQNCGDFFLNTLDTLDNAYIRPRYDGYVFFQDTASLVLHKCLMGAISGKECISEMKRIYRESMLR